MGIVRLLLIVALVVVVMFMAARRVTDRPVVFHTQGGETPATPGYVRARTPAPVSPGFGGCPGEGDGGDRQLNRLKNRIDSASWVETPFASVVGLSWPQAVLRRTRDGWTARDSVTVAAKEGDAIAVEGYVVGAKVEGPEATNCHGADSKFRDWHVWLAAEPGKNRRRSIVVETTPAVRAHHPEWSLTTIHKLARDSTRVRISGWLLLDPEHPDQLGKTRGTLWEVHPVMRIEVLRDGRWTDLQKSPTR
jgi:hypothetical protein